MVEVALIAVISSSCGIGLPVMDLNRLQQCKTGHVELQF
jgi:hypothetical protein